MAFPTIIVNRRLVRATGWSLVLHLVILWPAVVLVTPAGGEPGGSVLATRGRLDGRLRVPATTVSAPEPFDKTQQRSVLKGTGRALPQTPTSGGRAVKAPLPGPTTAAANEDAGIDADDLRTYRMSLALQARPYWRYPAEALQVGEGGTVEIRVTFSGNGNSGVSLERSSGHRPLDDAAQQMLRAALARAKQPEALRGKAFSLVMPVVFEPGKEAGR